MMEKEQWVDTIVNMEWNMFQEVQNQGGRAACQENEKTFRIMRKAQARTRSLDLLRLYAHDLEQAREAGVNLMTEKYARMMEFTHPEEYVALKNLLPEINDEKRMWIQRIMDLELKFQKEFAEDYPCLAAQGRPATHNEERTGATSIETYLGCELATYSLDTLRLYAQEVKEMMELGINRVVLEVYEMMRPYGFSDLVQSEAYCRQKKEKRQP